ncbi:MAG: hypothetical protein AAFY56_18240 [Pseudomonadota bacterium]
MWRFTAAEQRCGIACAVHDSGNNEFGCRRLVVNYIIAVKMCTQTFGEMIAPRPDFRMMTQRLKSLLDLTDEAIGARF